MIMQQKKYQQIIKLGYMYEKSPRFCSIMLKLYYLADLISLYVDNTFYFFYRK